MTRYEQKLYNIAGNIRAILDRMTADLKREQAAIKAEINRREK